MVKVFKNLCKHKQKKFWNFPTYFEQLTEQKILEEN